MHVLIFIVVCLLWGTNFILMKKAVWPLGAFGPLSVGGSRILCGVAILGALWWLVPRRRGVRWPLGWSHFWGVLGLAGIGMMYPYAMQPYLIGKHGDSAFFGMMVVWTPLMTLVVSVPILNVWPTRRQIAGVLLGLGCMVVLFDVGHAKGVGWVDLLLAGLVPLGYALSNTWIKKYHAKTSPLALTLLMFAMAGFVILPAAAMTEPIHAVKVGLSVMAMLWMGLIGTGVAVYLFYRLVTERGPLWAGMVTYVIPLGALAWGWFDGETIRPGQLGALGGIFLALMLVQWPQRIALGANRT